MNIKMMIMDIPNNLSPRSWAAIKFIGKSVGIVAAPYVEKGVGYGIGFAGSASDHPLTNLALHFEPAFYWGHVAGQVGFYAGALTSVALAVSVAADTVRALRPSAKLTNTKSDGPLVR